MSRSIITNSLILLAVTIHVRCQYIDFIQSLNSFIQPYQTTRRSDVITRRPVNKQTMKQRYQDMIFFETDQFAKQKEGGTLDPFTTTSKPRRKTKATTRKPTRTQGRDIDRDNNNNQGNNGNNNYNSYNYDQNNNINRETTVRPLYNYGTQRPNSRPIYNKRTTINPLLNRPGVRPAPVDDSRPPITNRPVTSWPLTPVTSRPVTGDSTTPGIETGPNEDDMSEVEKRRFIEMAEQKCDEYKSMNTKKIVALPLATIHNTQGVELNVSTCTPINIPLIIGGKPANIREFPHMGLVGWKNIQKVGYSWKCGGSLISERFLLTAGHCTYHDKDYNVISGPPAAVQLGSSYIDGQDSLVISVSTVIRHPKYKMRRSYYDVALIKLVTTVTFTESISPACLGVPPAVGKSVIATGWGRTEFGGEASKDLRSVAVSIWDMDECRQVWGTSRKMPEGPSSESQLCAGVREGGKDTCQGDSGGPVQIQDGCSWRVVGITSIGRACGAVDTPALYARLPRAFISSQAFANVKLNNKNNNNQNSNNNGNNGNNNGNNDNNNWSYNGFNQGSSNTDGIIRPGNHQTVGNNWGVTSINNNFGSRPGNHQTISSNNRDNNQFVSQNTNNGDNAYRPGNHQVVNNNNNRDVNNGYYNSNSGNNEETIKRPGNHQTIDNNNRNDAVNFFVTSHTLGNRDNAASRPGNHQTVDNRDTNTGNNYFVTSHTSGSNRDMIGLPGNHQAIGNNNRGASRTINRFADSQNSESNQDSVYDVRQQDNDNNKGSNSNYEDVRNGDNWENNNARRETNNQYSNERNGYNNNDSQNSRTTKTYSGFGTQNSNYGTTESVYNGNNNGYNGNNNRNFGAVSRPWWSR